MSLFRKVGIYELTATPSYASTGNTKYTTITQMDRRKSSGDSGMTGTTSPKVENHVTIQDNNKRDVEKREKYLTAKYGAHQMSLIKKRLAVEMWIFEQLGRLYGREDDDYDCNLELEEILNMDTDSDRRDYAWTQLTNVKESREEVEKFITELLKRAKTL